jgi:hypothetical protein
MSAWPPGSHRARAVTEQPNTYQPSPRQVSRSSPSGRGTEKTRDRQGDRRITAFPFRAIFVSSAGYHPDARVGPNTY